MTEPRRPESDELRPTDRFLRLFSDVRAGEGLGVLLMFANIFLVLVGYYVIKTVREPLILTGGGAEVKTYASAGQALVLIGFIAAYSVLAARVKRSTLVLVVTLFYVACIAFFEVAIRTGMPYVGIVFFIWVGIFNFSIISQFWSYANDIYTKPAGERLFPAIALGATIGSPIGAWIAGRLFELGQPLHFMLRLSAVTLLCSLGLYVLMNRRTVTLSEAPKDKAVARGNAFPLIFRSPYLLAIGGLLIVANLVNTAGEYILSSVVTKAAAGAADQKSFIGAFYGDYLFWTSIAAAVIQAFITSRLVKTFGLRGVLLALPLVALGGYGLIVVGAGLGAVRLAKIAENSTDYSIMNTGKQLLWLPTTREEKYKAKQAIDTFFVRAGDVVAALVVFVGTQMANLGARGFAIVNVALILVWLVLVRRVIRLNEIETRKLAAAA